MTENKSEIARLRKQLDAQGEAARSFFSAPAIVASHRVITNRYKHLERIHRELIPLVGKEEAGKMIGAAYVEMFEAQEHNDILS